jgi:hypothetical protein
MRPKAKAEASLFGVYLKRIEANIRSLAIAAYPEQFHLIVAASQKFGRDVRHHELGAVVIPRF